MSASLSQLNVSERVIKQHYGLAIIWLPNPASTDPDAAHPESASPFCSTVEAYSKTHPAATQERPHQVAWCHTNTIVPEKIQGVQAWDRYAYANNNPVRFNDPSGHCIGPFLAVCIAVATFIADNAAAITTVALTGAIMSFVGPSNPDPQLINDPVASQQALENSAFQALGWMTLGQASLEFASIASPSVPILPDRTNPRDKTTGVLIAGGEQTTLISGRNGPASQMPPGASGYDIVSRTHVEGHASALMTQNDWTTGTLWQNNIPCTSCTTNLPRMLPTNTTLRIIVPGEYDRIFTGR